MKMDAFSESVASLFAVNLILVTSDGTADYFRTQFGTTLEALLSHFPQLTNLQGM